MTAVVIPFPGRWVGEEAPQRPAGRTLIGAIPADFTLALLASSAAVAPGPAGTTVIVEAGPPVYPIEAIADAWDTIRETGRSPIARMSVTGGAA